MTSALAVTKNKKILLDNQPHHCMVTNAGFLQP